jgi:FkbM family methyltransferase
MDDVYNPFHRLREVTKFTLKYILAHTFVKQWRTNRIQLPHSSHYVYVNPYENRGRVLMMMNGMTQPRLNHFWKRAVALYQPTLVIDVGVNYGECLFSVKYPDHCNILGVEANVKLRKYIERSRRKHPDRERIHMVYAIASNKTQMNQPFFVHKLWSGLSSAGAKPMHDLKNYETQYIQSVTLDQLLHEQPLEAHKVLFKIDVEGNEQRVLEGMLSTIERCGQMLGIVEFDSNYLVAAGADLDAYLQSLQSRFQLYFYAKDRELVHIPEVSYEKLQQWYRRKHIHTDILLVSPGTQLPQLDVKIVHSV